MARKSVSVKDRSDAGIEAASEAAKNRSWLDNNVGEADVSIG
jgi:hypothetical protein